MVDLPSIIKRKSMRLSKVEITVSTKRVLAPLKTMEKVLMGMNYVDHCTEQNFPILKEPIIFNKMPSTVTNPGDDIELCPYIKELDFEANS